MICKQAAKPMRGRHAGIASSSLSVPPGAPGSMLSQQCSLMSPLQSTFACTVRLLSRGASVRVCVCAGVVANNYTTALTPALVRIVRTRIVGLAQWIRDSSIAPAATRLAAAALANPTTAPVRLSVSGLRCTASNRCLVCLACTGCMSRPVLQSKTCRLRLEEAKLAACHGCHAAAPMLSGMQCIRHHCINHS